ncbi:biotin-dependent carboxyltransferase family protein [uncultured Algibacter sp.]|uniref:5-oxoprolinase subunit C family protein n=1 Tax=uncultured Algibacter sp. TaxID=298659 RepID=UPI0026208B82|nr:biotin-dependent carboxyltransferase family protein [uncultured Algibacter sp.]
MVKVLKSGFYSTIQDFGRNGFQHYGVPYSGAMDRYAASLVNGLLGNIKTAAVIEMTMTGATLLFNCDTFICISGANFNPRLNDLPILNYKVIKVCKNDVLSFGKLELGFRCYLGVSGGFETETIMGSKSMYRGITSKYVIKKHDELSIFKSSVVRGELHAKLRINKSYLETFIIEVFKGPEFDLLTNTQQEKLLTNSFTISMKNNRMAYQIEEFLENNLEAIITSAVLPGTVQLTPSGKLIVLMRDCQTTGGYPRVLQLKESSINILAQKYTNNKINFKLLSMSL